MAVDQEARKVVENIDSGRDGLELFKIAKQRAGKRRDVARVSRAMKVGQ